MASQPFLLGRDIYLRAPLLRDVNAETVGWLNDPQVNAFSRRRFAPTGEAEAAGYVRSLGPDERVLAICTYDHRQIGNVKYGPINWPNRYADISILIGDKESWGKGYGTQAIYLVCKHAFRELRLHRLEAGSCNPGFIRSVEKIGWKVEGTMRERFFADGKYLDYVRLAQLSHEFTERSELEPPQ